MTLSNFEPYRAKLITAESAARLIKPGNHVFIGTACATPRTLMHAIEALPQPPVDVEFLHFITTGAVHQDATGRVTSKYRHRTFFVGSDMRAAVKQGIAGLISAITRIALCAAAPTTSTETPRLTKPKL
jgi:acyl-CoA hydrolase